MNMNSFPPVAPQRRGGWGPMFGIFIIVLLLIVGALYFWGEKLSKQQSAQPQQSGQTQPQQQTQPQSTGDTATDSLLSLSSSDNLSMIEADLNATDLATLDSGASTMDTSINSL